MPSRNALEGASLDTRPRCVFPDRGMSERRGFGYVLRRYVLPLFMVLVVAGLAAKYARKAANDRSAFVRWRPQIQALVHGDNVYDEAFMQGEDGDETDPDRAYPNPPLLAICLYPLTLLPPVAGAVTWFVIKAGMLWWLFAWTLKLAAGTGRPVPFWAGAIIVALSIRPLTSDLDHGNVNILIAFLIVASLWLFANGRDVWSGLLMALATVFKVTPALFIVYFAWKRQWKLFVSSLAGLLLFFIVIPSAVLGPAKNVELLYDWYAAMVKPYVVDIHVETRQHNQSMPGLVHRWLTPSEGLELKRQPPRPVNVASLDKEQAQWIVRVLSGATVLLLAWLCRTPTNDRRDWRLACEYGLVIIATLILSERTWKHHYTTIVMPIAALGAYEVLRARGWLKAMVPVVLVGALLLMSSTSSEVGRLFGGGQGHKYAQAAGAFLWAAVLLAAGLGVILRRHCEGDSTPNR